VRAGPVESNEAVGERLGLVNEKGDGKVCCIRVNANSSIRITSSTNLRRKGFSVVQVKGRHVRMEMREYHTYHCENADVKLEFTSHSYLVQILNTATPAVELKHFVNLKALVITGAPADRRWSLTEPKSWAPGQHCQLRFQAC
jgi:hypothetical protein